MLLRIRYDSVHEDLLEFVDEGPRRHNFEILDIEAPIAQGIFHRPRMLPEAALDNQGSIGLPALEDAHIYR